MAEALERLNAGTFTANDIRLIEHESFETKFEKLFKTTYREAHDKTEVTGRIWGR